MRRRSRGRRWPAIAALAALLASSSRAGDVAIISVEQYSLGVRRAAAAAASGDAARAREEASALLAARIDTPEGTLPPDAMVLEPAASARTEADARACAASLDALADSLGGGIGGSAPADDALLRELEAANSRAARPEGGSLLTDDLNPPTLTERATDALTAVADAIRDALGRLAKWLIKLLRLLPAPEAESGMGAMSVGVVTLIAVLAGVLLLLAIEAVRRRRVEAAPEDDSQAERVEKDADPLARTVAGWELRAAELAAAGRLREAVRAWYNGVLATLHAKGLLHYIKGRTNWEYVALLAPDVAWRPQFRDLTSRFDREWYGLNATTPDALVSFESLARHVIDAARRGRP